MASKRAAAPSRIGSFQARIAGKSIGPPADTGAANSSISPSCCSSRKSMSQWLPANAEVLKYGDSSLPLTVNGRTCQTPAPVDASQSTHASASAPKVPIGSGPGSDDGCSSTPNVRDGKGAVSVTDSIIARPVPVPQERPAVAAPRRVRMPSVDEWEQAATWWVDAVRDDPGNSTDFLDLVRELVPDGALDRDGITLDAGCGEGQVMRLLGGTVVGTDVSGSLLRRARTAGPVVQARLPDLSWARTGAFDRGVCVGVLDVVADHVGLFRELRRAIRPGGWLVVVVNHPVATAPRAEALVDPTGEVLWRWGDYLEHGRISQVAGEHELMLHHRPLGDLLSVAADVGWQLDRLVEQGPSAATRERYPDYYGQSDVPVLLGVRWTNRA